MSDPYDPEGNAGMDGVQEQFRDVPSEEPVTEAMVDAFMEELRRQGVVFDDFSGPIYPVRLYLAMRSALEDTRHAD